jgi:ABC-type phosphate transport system ATPase subunit
VRGSIGETGGGKSTVAKLLCRFYELTGNILIDGVDYRKRSLHWLQSNLGIVLQEPHLFSGTIRENIRYGRLAATDAEVEAVGDGWVSISSPRFRWLWHGSRRRIKTGCRPDRSNSWRWPGVTCGSTDSCARRRRRR